MWGSVRAVGLALLSLSATGEEKRVSTASARSTRMIGFQTHGPVPFTDAYRLGDGAAQLEVKDKVLDPAASEGDEATLSAHFSAEGDRYSIELTHAGLRSGGGARGAPLGGGVILDTEVNGSSGLGYSSTTRGRAAIAVWGIGTVRKNGKVLTTRAVISAMALSRGVHADDDTHRLLPEARDGDAELEILATELPRAEEPNGFVQFGFDDVSITLNGRELQSVAALPTVGERRPEETGVGGAGTAGGAPLLLPSYGVVTGQSNSPLGSPEALPSSVGGDLSGQPGTAPLNSSSRVGPSMPGQAPLTTSPLGASGGGALSGQVSVGNAPLKAGVPSGPAMSGQAPLTSSPLNASTQGGPAMPGAPLPTNAPLNASPGVGGSVGPVMPGAALPTSAPLSASPRAGGTLPGQVRPTNAPLPSSPQVDPATPGPPLR